MSKPIAPSDAADKFMLRLPDGMRDRLKAEAEANGRSMNAEIIARVQYTLDLKKIQAEEKERMMNDYLRAKYEEELARMKNYSRHVADIEQRLEQTRKELIERGLLQNEE